MVHRNRKSLIVFFEYVCCCVGYLKFLLILCNTSRESESVCLFMEILGIFFILCRL
jgi:hypothetical protein